jgi:hypothetical protein
MASKSRYIKKKPEDKLKTGPKPMGLKRTELHLLKDDFIQLKKISSALKLSISHLVRMAIAKQLQEYKDGKGI